MRARTGEFTGFVEWNRQASLGSDEIADREADSDRELRFDTIRSIARKSDEASAVTLADGSEITLSETSADSNGTLASTLTMRAMGEC